MRLLKFIRTSLVAGLYLMVVSAGAQTLGSGVPIAFTTNVLMQSGNGNFTTNPVTITVPAERITLAGVVNTNEIFIGSYGVQITAAGLTQTVWFSSLTNSFSLLNGGTNNGTWTTNVPAMTITVSAITAMQANIGANTNQASVSP